MRILVIKPSSFGDIIHLFPALWLMREKFPDAEMDFVVNPEFASLPDFSPFPVSRKIIFERKLLASRRFFLELLRLRRDLRQYRYDVAIDFQGLLRSGFIAFLSRAGVRAGFLGARERTAEIFYDRRIDVGGGHAVMRYVRLVQKLFDTAKEAVQPDLPEHKEALADLPLPAGKYIALLPGTRWRSKRFPAELFREIVAAIAGARPELSFVAAGGNSEREIADAIGGGVMNLAGKTTIPQLMELLRGAEAVIGNDSGPLHAAAALKRPVFGLYGATDPALTGPWGGNCRFFTAGCECAGCLKRECPDGSYRCWRLDAGEIARAVVKTLEKEE